MDKDLLVNYLKRGRATFPALVSGLNAEEVRWKPAPDKWSILEVICHLGDEEVLDFRTRLEYVLTRPGEDWPPINPDGWVTERRYIEQDFEASLTRFLKERDRSLAWLAGMDIPSWVASHGHPQAGTLHAGDLALSWAAHDLLHIRQIFRLLYQRLEERGKPYSAEYAGGW